MTARAFALAAPLLAFAAVAADLQPSKDAGPYVPSPESVVSDMLRYAEVGPRDFLIDLGSGDGRIVLTAAKLFGARGFGVEIKEDLVKRANEAAHKEGLADREFGENIDAIKDRHRRRGENERMIFLQIATHQRDERQRDEARINGKHRKAADIMHPFA